MPKPAVECFICHKPKGQPPERCPGHYLAVPGRCLSCLGPIYTDQSYEQAVDLGLVTVGHVHSGTCAHQWRLRNATY